MRLSSAVCASRTVNSLRHLKTTFFVNSKQTNNQRFTAPAMNTLARSVLGLQPPLNKLLTYFIGKSASGKVASFMTCN